MKFLVSVVIPLFNSEDYIEETLKSLSQQTDKRFEVILVDDISSDKSVAVAKAALEVFGLNGRVIVRGNDVVKGVSSCRNIGIRAASAEWVAFLDSDDLFRPEMIAVTAGKINAFGDHVAAFTHSVNIFKDGTGETLQTKVLDFGAEPVDIFPKLAHINFITTSAVTLKKSVVLDLGCFDTTLFGIEDYMMWLRISKRSKWVYSKEVLTDYRVRESSLMGGRRFTYYIGQNNNLIASLVKTTEFSRQDIEKVNGYVRDVTKYYAMISLDQYGWGDFFKGVAMLAKTGRVSLASYLVAFHSKNLFLRKAHGFFRK